MSFDFMRIFAAEAHIEAGSQERALAILNEYKTLTTVGLKYPENFMRGMVTLLQGDIEGALDWAFTHRPPTQLALDMSWSEGHTYLIAFALAEAGRLKEFDAHLAMISSLATSGSINNQYLTATFSHATVLAVLRGQMDVAKNWAERAIGMGLSNTVSPGFSANLAYTLATASNEECGRELWKSAHHDLSTGCNFTGVMLGLMSLRYDPDPDHARQISEAANATESPFIRHLGDFAAAIGDPSPERYQQLSRDLTDAGMILHAWQAAVRAAASYRDIGDFASAIEMADEIYANLPESEPDVIILMRIFVNKIGITEREFELLSMFATGATAREIAETLVLSVRTVEQHSLRLCRKLGVSGRPKLIMAARTWLAPFLPTYTPYSPNQASK